MADYTVWWILAALLVGAELLTGTFYLLAIAVAFAVGGLAAWLGLSLEAQFGIAALVGLVGTALAHHWRARNVSPAPDPAFDIGQSVRVQGWNADGSARVAYRGSLWTGVTETPDAPRAPVMYIVAMRGSTLVLSERRPGER